MKKNILAKLSIFLLIFLITHSMTNTNKPHAVCIPFPAQSHMKGIMKVAKLLHHRGFYITFVNTEFIQNRLISSKRSKVLESFPDFKFETIPDGLPPSNLNATQDGPSLCGAVRRTFLKPFLELVERLNARSSSTSPPVTCIVADGIMPFALAAGKELGIPVTLYWTFSACGFWGFYQYKALIKKGYAPLRGDIYADESYLTNGHLDTVLDWVPGMKDIRLEDLPTLFQTTDPNCEIFNLCMEAAQAAVEATAFGLHTYDALEPGVLEALSSIFPHVYTIGPLQLLSNQAKDNDQIAAFEYSSWEEDQECLNWLESRPSNSVLYVSFGSVAMMSKEHLVEFAWGLANSNHYFLWIIRPDIVSGKSAVLPPEFGQETKERCYITSWCPQEEVLNHTSIGEFLTHCGWNSTIESLTAGVPMICWPYFADQLTNCRFACNEWEVGMEIETDVKRDDVENIIRELFGGEKGKKMKEKAMEWKKLAAKATSLNGSSSVNLDKLVNVLLTV